MNIDISRLRGEPGMKISVLFLFLSILFLASCGSVEIESQWRESEITIDGKLSDWQGRLWEIENTGVSIGVLNDDENIYLCLAAVNPQAAGQVLRQGLIAWFDPKGGKDKVLGIHFPLGRELGEFEGPMNPDTGVRDSQRGQRENLDEIEILGPGRDEKVKMRVSELKGIEVSIEPSAGMLVYELKIPLKPGDQTPHAAGTEPGKIVGIGFDSSRPDMLMPGRGMGGIPGGGGFGPGMRGGMPGGGGMARMGRGFRGQEPLKLWLKVQLALQPK